MSREEALLSLLRRLENDEEPSNAGLGRAASQDEDEPPSYLELEEEEERRREREIAAVVSIIKRYAVDWLAGVLLLKPEAVKLLRIPAGEPVYIPGVGKAYPVSLRDLDLPPQLLNQLEDWFERRFGRKRTRIDHPEYRLPAWAVVRAYRLASRTGKSVHSVLDQALRIGLAVLERKHGLLQPRR